MAWLALALLALLLDLLYGCTVTRPESMVCRLECVDCARVVLICEDEGGVEIAPRSAQSL